MLTAFVFLLQMVCAGEKTLRVKIVPMGETDKYIAISGNEARIMTKKSIHARDACSQFVIHEDTTRIVQGSRFLCKKMQGPGIVPCTLEDEKSVWTIVPIKDSGLVRMELGTSGSCLRNDGPMSADSLGNQLSVDVCDEGSRSQRFKIKRIVQKKK